MFLMWQVYGTLELTKFKGEQVLARRLFVLIGVKIIHRSMRI
jgi:hypothetical protein